MKVINFTPSTFEPLRQLALLFPNAEDSLSHYNTPSIKIKQHLLCRLHENGAWFAMRTDFKSRDEFLEQYPESCFITPHHKNYPYICVHTANYTVALLKAILESGYKAITEKKP